MSTSTAPLSASASIKKRDGFLARVADPTFNIVTIGLLLLAAAAIIYPLYFIVIASTLR